MSEITLRFGSEDNLKHDLQRIIKNHINRITRGRCSCPECGAFHFSVAIEYYTVINIHNIPKVKDFYLKCRRCGYRF